MCFDMLFHMRFILTPKNVLNLPFWGSNPPYFFIFFWKLQENYSAHKKYVETKVVDLKKLILGTFCLRTIFLQKTNLGFFKTFASAGNEGTQIICMYTANHGNMYVHFRFVVSLRRYAESYLLVHKALITVHVIWDMFLL